MHGASQLCVRSCQIQVLYLCIISEAPDHWGPLMFIPGRAGVVPVGPQATDYRGDHGGWARQFAQSAVLIEASPQSRKLYRQAAHSARLRRFRSVFTAGHARLWPLARKTGGTLA